MANGYGVHLDMSQHRAEFFRQPPVGRRPYGFAGARVSKQALDQRFAT